MIGIIGDLHFKDALGYADYIKGRREKEREDILNYIVEKLKDCGTVIMLGDQLNGRSNSPHVIKMFVNFVERFSDKQVYIIAGNHEKFGNGKSAIDFLGEIKNPNWHIITKNVEKHQIGGVSAVFCPYFTKSEIEADNNEEALKIIGEKLVPGDVLFHHHTMGMGGKIAGLALDINQMPEPVIPIEDLQKKYKFVFGGHIHKAYTKFKNAVVTGSVFNNEVGETQKYIWKFDDKNNEIKKIEIPGRKIRKIENPTDKDIESFSSGQIIKVIITEKKTDEEMEKLKKELKKVDAYILIERLPKKRKKMHYTEGESVLEFDINKLLEIYSKEKGVDFKELKHGFELIRE